MIKKRDYITLSVLGGIFLCLLLVFILAVAPLLKEDKNGRVPPEILDGEYTNGVNVSLYPPISDGNLLEIKVENGTGEYSFIQKTEKDKTSMVIKGHEYMTYDNAVYAYLSVFAKEPKVPMDGVVIRNVTEAQMSQYGTTELLCNAKVTVSYKVGNETKTHKLLIGNKVMSSAQSYYVAVEGRSHVYLINASFVDNAILKSINDYISPAIYSKYKNAAEAGLAIKQFIIMLTNQKGDMEAKEIVMVEQDKELIGTSTSSTFKFTYPGVYPQKIIASNDYVLGVYGQLYINFAGDKVVALNPDQATLEKYGLGKEQEQYMIYASVHDQTDKNYIPAIYVSKEFIKEVDGVKTPVHYVMSGYHAEVTIVEVPAEQMFFLKSDDQTMLDWSATNSIFAGFSEYLRPEPDINAPGVKVMKIKTKDFDETFDITIDKNGRLSAISRSGKYSFIDKIGATEAYTTNQFSNLYTLLLYYPMPSRFNTLSDDERDSVRVEENIIYQLEVEMNDGTLYKYTYYTLDEMYSGYALCESIEGRINGNGEAEYKSPQAIFDVKSRHIGLIAEKYKIILEGGSFNPMDYIY